MLRQWLEGLSLRAVRHRLDKRKLQEELDLHRLFLLTKWHAEGGGDDAAEQLDREARELGPEGTRAAVTARLVQQVLGICHALHAVLDGDDVAAQQFSTQHPLHEQRLEQPMRGGLGATMGVAHHAVGTESSQKSSPTRARPQWRRRLTQQLVSEAFAQAHGFTLSVEPSSVQHADSGDGLWMCGRARVGEVVALYPGVAYPPLCHRQIPGYPLVARSNPYLLSRFDGTVLDAKPWGKGSKSGVAADDGWPEEVHNEAERALAQLEGRHPLAFAHMANHPPAGTAPNVVVAACDLDWRAIRAAPHLRAYLPTLCYANAAPQLPAESAAPSLALVASRTLEDEEVFLNYRLNPHAPIVLPAWYRSCDSDEDARRWA